jgi:exonuclease III
VCVQAWWEREAPDILCLQETKMNTVGSIMNQRSPLLVPRVQAILVGQKK